MTALAHVKHSELRQTALRMIADGDMANGISLLANNFEAGDFAMCSRHLKPLGDADDAHRSTDLTERQRKVMNLLLDAGPNGFEGGMSTRKYEGIAATSRATASRELIELAAKRLLLQVGGGRSTRYYLNLPGWRPAELG